jgi:organic radical activating enzyme
MKINNVYYSLKGDGIGVGKVKLFVRFGDCNLRCNYCNEEKITREISPKDKRLMAMSNDWCFVGGEPMLYEDQLLELIKKYNVGHVELETNGIIIPSNEDFISYFDLITVSPREGRHQVSEKLKKVNKINKVINTEPSFIEHCFVKRSPQKTKLLIKFTYIDKESEAFIFRIIQKYAIHRDMVAITPEGGTRKEQLNKYQTCWDFCLINGFRFSPKLHILTFNGK